MTFGVEEEFFLLDAETGTPLPWAKSVLADSPRLPGGAELHQELRQTQVEAATGICDSPGPLRHQLLVARGLLSGLARRHGAVVAASGTSLCSGPGPGPGGNEGRFAAIDATYRDIATGYEACGCHVHVGVPDGETAIAVLNHVRPWLPTLLALSVNSPFHDGRDTGYGSWRMVLQSRFPGAGIPRWFASVDDYEREVARLVSCGALVDAGMTFWLARKSASFPTIEFRVADTAMTANEALLQALLSRALVRRALDDLALGVCAPHVSDQVAAAALWAAARDGIAGTGVDPLRAQGARGPAGFPPARPRSSRAEGGLRDGARVGAVTHSRWHWRRSPTAGGCPRTARADDDARRRNGEVTAPVPVERARTR